MSEDRKVFTDALQTLGTIIGPNEKRDAIHLAVVPVIAPIRLEPGEHVGPDGYCNDPMGIVDPFLPRPVFPGERFWLVIYPRQITSLRHVWEHPAFPNDTVKIEASEDVDSIEKSKQWMRHFLDTYFYEDDVGHHIYKDVDAFITDVTSNIFGGKNNDERSIIAFGASSVETLISYSDDDYAHTMEKFWHHYEVITGKNVSSERQKELSFVCGC